jgi:hypothetical protein
MYGPRYRILLAASYSLYSGVVAFFIAAFSERPWSHDFSFLSANAIYGSLHIIASLAGMAIVSTGLASWISNRLRQPVCGACAAFIAPVLFSLILAVPYGRDRLVLIVYVLMVSLPASLMATLAFNAIIRIGRN